MAMLPVHVRGPLDRLRDRLHAIVDRLPLGRRGEKGEEHEEQGRGFYRLERCAGAFVRSVALPCEVDPHRTSATYRDGVLRVSLPKPEASRARGHRARPRR
jgi:HSP20 family protein